MFSPGTLTQVKQRSFIAFGSGTTLATAAQIPFWIPRDARFISFILVGAGGGGAGGATGAITTSRRGGGGGGSGAVSSAIYSTRSLPEIIYLLLSGGGLGGNANSNGNLSVTSAVTFTPTRSTNLANIILAATPGSVGQVVGAGGAGGANVPVTSVGMSTPLTYNTLTGITGGASGNAAATTDSFLTVAIGSQAPAGGSTNLGTPFAGGRIITNATAGVNIFNLPGSTPLNSGGANTGAPGINGYSNLDNISPYADAALPIYSIPGSGGGAIDSGTGGRGGNGAPGCGGSGGGAGTTGGAGGNGGSSFCIVEWW